MAKHKQVKGRKIARPALPIQIPVQIKDKPKDPSRRQFVNQALAVSAGVALSGFLPHLKSAAQNPPACTPVLGKELENPGEIGSDANGLLQAVVRVHDEVRQVSYIDAYTTGNPPACTTLPLRAYEGYKGFKIAGVQPVTKRGVFGPGPTFRAPVGGMIQIALLNHINPNVFPESPNNACDVTKSATGQELYPDSPAAPAQRDEFPDCFRGSNTTNLHFHGTHVSPNAFSDNVLIEIVPDLKATPLLCELLFPTVACKDYPNPHAWKHVDLSTSKSLQQLIQRNQERLKQLDRVSPELDATNKDLHARQAQQNENLQNYEEFPQYWAGCFPYCIRPPKYTPGGPYAMGQAPGTHWYHAHKHGSTSIQVYNGMAGALIIEGDYDKTLRKTMPAVKEKVLVIQQFSQQPNRQRTGGAGVTGGGPNRPQGMLVNGQLQPVITMQTNEVQWWRLIDATVQGNKGNFLCSFVSSATSGANIVFRQTAQDGVQFAWENYQPQIAKPPSNFILAPGNRADILVQAPSAPGTATLQVPGAISPIILTVNVVTGSGQYNTKWPNSQSEYPEMPPFLADITEVSECRYLKYQMAARGSTPTINGKTFQEGIVDEAMLLGTKQEWVIENYSTSSAGSPLHPFHIHVNPFQIIELFDPNTMSQPLKLPQPWVWWDTFPIPLGKTVGSKVVPGYFKMRTFFADFAGKFVDHCHILAHEDRGMMQLIEVIDNKTVVKHH